RARLRAGARGDEQHPHLRHRRRPRARAGHRPPRPAGLIPDMTRFWVGGYGADMEGDADGIGFLATEDQGGPTTLAYRGLGAPAASPSWLARHPSLDVVYAALEGVGAVQAFARAGEATLAPLGDALPAGDSVCHLAASPDGR